MANHDENFKEPTGYGWIIINLIALAWVTMPVSIGLSKVMW